MSEKTVYVLHKHGSPSHYSGLQYLLKKNNIDLKFREFSIITKIYKSLVKLDVKTLVKQLTNIGFFISLLLTKDKKVVLGIAPFDKKLGPLLRYLKNHKIYYHTSWTVWDKSFHPNTRENSDDIFNIWQAFLERKVQHIFCVTLKSKNQLLKNYNIQDSKITIVYHALHEAFLKTEKSCIDNKELNSFIYYGRMLPQKGIDELLHFFSENNLAKLTLVGNGKESEKARVFGEKFQNIEFIDYLSDKYELINHLKRHQYLILNSKKTDKWEELFGLVIIEAMSQGVIPIASAHSGPKEIINEEIGYMFEEGEMAKILKKLIEEHKMDRSKALNAMAKSKLFAEKNIAERWQAILD